MEVGNGDVDFGINRETTCVNSSDAVCREVEKEGEQDGEVKEEGRR